MIAFSLACCSGFLYIADMIKFAHHDGCVTVAQSGEIGLRYWYSLEVHGRPKSPVEVHDCNGIQLIIHESVAIPEGQELVELSIAALERKYGRGPKVMGKTETQCHQVLNWMADHGEIVWVVD